MLVIPSVLHYDRDMKTITELWPGGLKYGGDSVGTDSLALADFAMGVPGRQCVDLGCGSGFLLLRLAFEREDLTARGIELRPPAAEECRENIRANGLQQRCSVVCADFRDSGLPGGSADLAVSNPPYFPAESGAVSPDGERALMRTETASLPELCAAAARLLRPGGAFCLVHRVWRMREVFSSLSASGLEPRRMRLIARSSASAPSLFMVEARKGAKPGLTAEPTLFQCRADGSQTDEYKRICHWEDSL